MNDQNAHIVENQKNMGSLSHNWRMLYLYMLTVTSRSRVPSVVPMGNKVPADTFFGACQVF